MLGQLAAAGMREFCDPIFPATELEPPENVVSAPVFHSSQLTPQSPLPLPDVHPGLLMTPADDATQFRKVGSSGYAESSLPLLQRFAILRQRRPQVLNRLFNGCALSVFLNRQVTRDSEHFLPRSLNLHHEVYGQLPIIIPRAIGRNDVQLFACIGPVGIKVGWFSHVSYLQFLQRAVGFRLNGLLNQGVQLAVAGILLDFRVPAFTLHFVKPAAQLGIVGLG